MRAVTLYKTLLLPMHRMLFLPDLPQSDGVGEEFHWCAIIMTVGLAYLFRLPPNERFAFTEHVDSMLSLHGCPEHLRIRPVLQECLQKVFRGTRVARGIAPTAPFMENVYATVVCLVAGIPLNLTGPPGCGKSLAIQVRTD